MEQNIGTLKGVLKLDDKAFTSSIKRAKANIASLGAAAAAMGATAALAMGTYAVNASAKLEQSITNAAVVTREGIAVYDQYKAATLETSKTAAQSARQMGDGLLYMGRAGMSAQESITGLPHVSALATAAMTDLGRTTDIATDTMSAFGKQAKDLGHIGDVLLTAMNRTNQSFEQLGESMKFAAPVARQAGQSIETTAAAIGLMANVGIKGSQAGTTLRMSLLRMMKPTRMSTKALKRLGLSVTDSRGKMRSLVDIVGQLEDAQARYGTQSAKFGADIARVFGVEAASGIQALVQQGSGALEHLRRELEASTGTTKMLEAQMLNTFSGQVKVAKGNLENLAAVVGDQMTPYVKAGAKALSDLASNWTDNAQGSDELKENIKALASVFVGMFKAMAVGAKIGGGVMKVFLALAALGESLGHSITGAGAAFMEMKERMKGNEEAARIWGKVVDDSFTEALGAYARLNDKFKTIDKTTAMMSQASDQLAMAVGGVNVKLHDQEKQLAKTHREFNKLMKTYRASGFLEMAVQGYQQDTRGGMMPLAPGQTARQNPASDQDFEDAHRKKNKTRTKPRGVGASAARQANKEAKKQLAILESTYALEMKIAREKDARARADLRRQLEYKKLAHEKLSPAQEALRIKQIELKYAKDLIAAELDAARQKEQADKKEAKRQEQLHQKRMKDKEALARYMEERLLKSINDPMAKAHAELRVAKARINRSTNLTPEARKHLNMQAEDKHSNDKIEATRKKAMKDARKVEMIYQSVREGIDLYSNVIGQVFGQGAQRLLQSGTQAVDSAVNAGMAEFAKAQKMGDSLEAAALSGISSLATSAQRIILEHEKTQQHFKVINQALKDLGMGDVLGDFLATMEPSIGLYIQISRALKPLLGLGPQFDLMGEVSKKFFEGTKFFIGGTLTVAESAVSAGHMLTGGALLISSTVNEVAKTLAGWASKFNIYIDISKFQTAVDKARAANEATGAAMGAIKDAQDELAKATMESAQQVYNETNLRADLNKQLREGVRNGPSGYKMAWARFEATQRAGMPTMGTLAQGSTTIGTVYIVAHDYADFERQMKLKAFKQTGSTQTQMAGIVPMSVARSNG